MNHVDSSLDLCKVIRGLKGKTLEKLNHAKQENSKLKDELMIQRLLTKQYRIKFYTSIGLWFALAMYLKL